MAAEAAHRVVVLGAGPAGCATAIALHQHGISDVLLVEAGQALGALDAVRVGESLPPDVRLLLQQLGLWQDFLAEGHAPCFGSCSVWGGDAPGYNDYLLNPHGHGWHLDRRRFDVFLARQALARGIQLLDCTRFLDAAPVAGGGYGLQLESAGMPRAVRAAFVVDATGRSARFARLRGTTRQFHDRLGYLAGFLDLPTHAAPFSRMTLLEAVEYGWWYAARLAERRVAVAVASDPDRVKQLGLHRPETWLARLRATRHVGPALVEGVPVPGRRAVCSAPSFLLDRRHGPDWLAVGDAASAYDPIAAQGIYKALLDGLEAADAIAAACDGESGPLDAYGAAVAERFDDYRANRDYFYGIEHRWPTASFWQRRK